MTFCDFCSKMPRTQVFYPFEVLLENLFVLESVHCAGERRNRTQSLPRRVFYFVRGDNCGGGSSVGFEECEKVAGMVPCLNELLAPLGMWEVVWRRLRE